MRLLIISHTEHYIQDGELVGWGPTVREISHLASIFDQVTHIAFLHQEQAPSSSLPYNANIHFVGLSPSGGHTWKAKLTILAAIPVYIRTILRELPYADVVHVRCPANISLIAIILLALLRKPQKRWVKYAGNWVSQQDAWSYRFQRWWLRHGLARAKVTINGEWTNTASHISTFYNPSLTVQNIETGRHLLTTKQMGTPLRLIFVGRIEGEKGVGRALQIVAQLASANLHFDVIGDGKDRLALEQQAKDLKIDHLVTFHGSLPMMELAQYYAQAHLMLFPSNASEGWPKVLSEGMAYGVVPIVGNISSIPQYIEKFGTGIALDPMDVEGFVQAVQWYQANPDLWKQQAQKGVAAAFYFSYEYYLDAVKRLLGLEDSLSS